MRHPDSGYLHDVPNAAVLIRQFVKGFGLDEFREDARTHSAVIRQLEIMGEAKKQLSLSLREANPDIGWRRIAGIRDVLIHQYRGVDLTEVWKAATISVPDLIPRIERILSESTETETE